MNRKAYLWSVVQFVPNDPIPKALGFRVTSDPTPTCSMREIWGLVLEVEGKDFEDALKNLKLGLEYVPYGKDIVFHLNLDRSKWVHMEHYDLGIQIRAQLDQPIGE